MTEKERIDKLERDLEYMRKTHARETDELKTLIDERFKEVMAKLDPVYDFYTNMTFSKKALIWVVSILGSMVGIIIGILQILRMMR